MNAGWRDGAFEPAGSPRECYPKDSGSGRGAGLERRAEEAGNGLGLWLRGIADEGRDRSKIRLEERLDHAGAGGDEPHHIVEIRVVVDALDPGRIRRARVGQRGDGADGRHAERDHEDRKDAKREPTTNPLALAPHGFWICSLLTFVKHFAS
jgi:hypothetical protein